MADVPLSVWKLDLTILLFLQMADSQGMDIIKIQRGSKRREKRVMITQVIPARHMVMSHRLKRL